MNFKKRVLGRLLCMSFCWLSAQEKPKLNHKACKFVKEQLTLVEKFYNLEEGYSLELMSASKFLGELTNLKSKFVYSCLTAEPTSDVDVSIWKKWYQENKHLLYWDNLSKTARVRLKSLNNVVTN